MEEHEGATHAVARPGNAGVALPSTQLRGTFDLVGR